MDTSELNSGEFWAKVYSNSGMQIMGKTDSKQTKAYALGGEIVKLLSRKYWILDDEKLCDVFISGSLGTHRVIKVECVRAVCTRDFVENVCRIVTGVDGSWGVRFAVYEALTLENSYLGGIIIEPNGNLTLEGIG